MLKEAIEYLFVRGQVSKQNEIIRVDSRRWLHVSANEYEWIDAEQPEWSHTLADVPSIISAISAWKTNDCCVFVSMSRVEAVLDRGDGIDRVSFPLNMSEPFTKLTELERYRTQEQIILCLRRHYLAANPNLKELIGRIDNLRWTHTNAATSEVRPESKGLSRAVAAQVTGADQLPETFTLNVPVFSNLDDRIHDFIDCTLIAHPDDEQLEIKLAPDAREVVVLQALHRLQSRIVELLDQVGVDCPVLLGTP